MMIGDEDEALFLREVEDFKIFHRRIPTLEDEAAIWQRIEDRKRRKDLREEHGTVTEPREIEPSP